MITFQCSLTEAQIKTDRKITELGTDLKTMKDDVSLVKHEQQRQKVNHQVLSDKVEDMIAGRIAVGSRGGSGGSDGGGGTGAAPTGNARILPAVHAQELETRATDVPVITFCSYKERQGKGIDM